MEHFLEGRLVDWITALGTVGATMAAVWLGLRQTRVRLVATADLSAQGAAARLYADSGPNALRVDLSNSGVIPIVVTGVYWRIRWGRKSEVLPLPVAPRPWPIPIPPGEGRTLAVTLADLTRTVIPGLRDVGTWAPLIVELATGKRVKCRLTREAKGWISDAVGRMRAADHRL